MTRKGSAVWTGNLKEGKGTVSTESGVLRESQYGFSSRFESGIGTNPEELIGAAHAGCFSMALSAALGEAGLTPDRIATTASVMLEKTDGGFGVTKIHLQTEASVPGAENDQFQALAAETKVNCPISKLLNAEITLDAKLV